ncbi:hypothetical protein ABZP36_006981 [Zizania latifolia]
MIANHMKATNLEKVEFDVTTTEHDAADMKEDDDMANNYIEHKLLIGGFVEVQASAASSHDTEQSVTIKAKKASWSMGSSFPLKKATKGLPKVQIDDDFELIEEDDLKKPQLPVGIVL